MHIKKIRGFHVRAKTVGGMFEDDGEYGRIHPAPSKLDSTMLCTLFVWR